MSAEPTKSVPSTRSWEQPEVPDTAEVKELEEKIQHIITAVPLPYVSPAMLETQIFPFKKEIAKIDRIAPIMRVGVFCLHLTNGFQVILKNTKDEDKKIHLQFQIPSGLNACPRKSHVALLYAFTALNDVGLGDHSKMNICLKVPNASKMYPKAEIHQDHWQISSEAMSEESLEHALGLLCSRIADTRPVTNPSFIDYCKRVVGADLSHLPEDTVNPFVQYKKVIADLLANQHSSYCEVTKEEIESINLQECVTEMYSCLRNIAGGTFVICGNFNIDTIIPIIQRYIGSIERPSPSLEMIPQDGWSFPKGKVHKRVQIGGTPGRIISNVYFPLHPEESRQEAHERLIVSAVFKDYMNDVLKLHQQKVFYFHTEVQTAPSDSQLNYFHFSFSSEPSVHDAVLETILHTLVNLQDANPDDLIPFLNDIKKKAQQQRSRVAHTSSYWFRKLTSFFCNGEKLEHIQDVITGSWDERLNLQTVIGILSECAHSEDRLIVTMEPSPLL